MRSNKWIESNGGPLILIPRRALAEWAGSGSNDYVRACAVTGYAGVISVSWEDALVLGDTPDSTTVIETPKGVALLRWLCADSEEEMLSAVLATSAAAPVVEVLEFCVTEEDHLLIDSAYAGIDFPDSLPVQLESGVYEIVTSELLRDRVGYRLHVFQKRKV